MCLQPESVSFVKTLTVQSSGQVCVDAAKGVF